MQLFWRGLGVGGALAAVALAAVTLGIGSGLPQLVAQESKTAAAKTAAAKKPVKVSFVKKQLDAAFRSEGVAVGDFNHDGKLDIAAGFVWYEAPEWKMHPIVEKVPEYNPMGYSNSFCNWAEDLNGDGWTDLIVVDFPGTPTWWFENPKQAGGPWKKHQAIPVTNNESPQYLDVDGDGKRELVMAFAPSTPESDGPERQMGIARPQKDPTAPWVIQAISAKGAPACQKYSHGLGIGDVNKDGRNDIVCPEGWWESPPKEATGEWKFHPAPFGARGAQMYVYDFDGDGDNDVLGSEPHGFGLWWFEQLPNNEWKQHEIDRSVSQLHGVILVDMNSDGLPDIVTGKRWKAHWTGDPGVDEPALFCWFELQRENGKPVWTRHQFDHDSGPGTQFEIADVNKDGLPDVITSNKKGVHYFQQVRE